ncbi:phosphoenolpyruvate synthase [Methanogenium organophilum]|uniref:Probable phosphoenolpyruvate synthase n=1 Tax=Methanogenium organophilum TaxID=2199 RepID=A0A9X9S5A1_METOG|nr:phosphoenolpyruvate synthase [Methanogenium organophilum]WAI02013.1 phosphoenolpyruvate synthase [Methanogenium organophilum]
MTKVPNILWLAEIQKEDVPSVGGKGASLGEMTSVGLPVPNAFVVTAQAFRRYIEGAKIDKEIFSRLAGLDVENADLLEKTAADVKGIVMKAPVPDEIREEIIRSYAKMGDDVVVAVRSSATAEDLPDASFAGQQDTYLNIKGVDALVEAVQMCWASLYGARAIYYRAKQGFDDSIVDIAVVVQQLVRSEKAGVLFSSHPVTGEPTSIIEGSWGLGEAVVSGTVSPDNYIFDARAGRVIDRYIATKKVEILPDGEHGTKEVPVPPERQDIPVLSDDEIAALAKFGKVSETHYGVPQDVEWSIVGNTIYILQSRPITTIAGNAGVTQETESSGEIILEGQGASPGIATGRVVLVNTVKDLGRINDGDIMVAKMTNPDMVPGMRKVSAIITDEGGMTCHAAIVSRELGTPAVVGTRDATHVLKEGDIVTVDGEKGIVFDGAIAPVQDEAPAVVVAAAAPIITATSVKVNVSLPEAAARAAATGADGVGLLRIEHMILGLNKTPGWYIRNNREEEFVKELYDGIKVVLDAFPGKPVWVRTLDAPTDEFRNMEGGEDEPEEHNPMLGWRGIRRDLQQTEQFRLQVEVFKRLWSEGYSNMGLMFPLVGHPKEFIQAKQMLAGWGVDVENTTLGIMVEIPSSALMIDEFIAAGINFASFGTNDLIQYTLAIDRNNQNVADMYFPKHPAVLKLIEYAIGRCREGGVECSICGQAGSDPEMVEWLIRTGITSVSSNIDAVQKIRETAARTEQRMLLDMARR